MGLAERLRRPFAVLLTLDKLPDLIRAPADASRDRHRKGMSWPMQSFGYRVYLVA